MNESQRDDFYLYHYTTGKGLKGIVEKREIWATSVFFLNDSEEWYHGMGEFEKRLEGLKATHPIFEKCLGAVRSATLPEKQGGFAPEKHLDMYVCSFSEKDDLLSQWRAYCPAGGFAIGFLKNKIASLARDQGFTLERCLYKAEDKIPKIDAILDQMRKSALETDRLMQADPGAMRKEQGRLVYEFAWEVSRTAVTLKHEEFSEEVEWRLASTLKTMYKPSELQFRASERAIVPYKVISLADDELWQYVDIIVGPSPDRQRYVEVVRRLLWNKVPALCAKIRPSKIPYRYQHDI